MIREGDWKVGVLNVENLFCCKLRNLITAEGALADLQECCFCPKYKESQELETIRVAAQLRTASLPALGTAFWHANATGVTTKYRVSRVCQVSSAYLASPASHRSRRHARP